MVTINYKGMKLEEVTEPQIFNPPKNCVVWDKDGKLIENQLVSAIIADNYYPVVTHDRTFWSHCALLSEKPAPRRATNRELAKWLAQGNGQVCKNHAAYTDFCYGHENEQKSVDDVLKVRKWDDTEWHDPDVEYMGLEDK